MPTQTVLEELTDERALTPEHVQRRVEDWASRIKELYSTIERWLPPGWRARAGDPVIMQEELMQRLDVQPRKLPTLELLQDDTVRLRLRPYGLWIIGVNGRIDLIKGNELYLILDYAKTFEAPDWKVSPAAARSDSHPFDKAAFSNLLSA